MPDSQAKSSFNHGDPPRRSLNSEEYQKEQQLMQDTHVLLTNLAEREKATVRAILNSLYEVGSIRLINKNVSVEALRSPLKGIATLSKPVFQLFAWRWFRRNCPELITTWLYQQVRFDDRSMLPGSDNGSADEPIEVLPTPELPPPVQGPKPEAAAGLSPIIEQQAKEILALRGRIMWLSSAVVLLMLVVCVKIFV